MGTELFLGGTADAEKSWIFQDAAKTTFAYADGHQLKLQLDSETYTPKLRPYMVHGTADLTSVSFGRGTTKLLPRLPLWGVTSLQRVEFPTTYSEFSSREFRVRNSQIVPVVVVKCTDATFPEAGFAGADGLLIVMNETVKARAIEAGFTGTIQIGE